MKITHKNKPVFKRTSELEKGECFLHDGQVLRMMNVHENGFQVYSFEDNSVPIFMNHYDVEVVDVEIIVSRRILE